MNLVFDNVTNTSGNSQKDILYWSQLIVSNFWKNIFLLEFNRTCADYILFVYVCLAIRYIIVNTTNWILINRIIPGSVFFFLVQILFQCIISVLNFYRCFFLPPKVGNQILISKNLGREKTKTSKPTGNSRYISNLFLIFKVCIFFLLTSFYVMPVTIGLLVSHVLNIIYNLPIIE